MISAQWRKAVGGSVFVFCLAFLFSAQTPSMSHAAKTFLLTYKCNNNWACTGTWTGFATQGPQTGTMCNCDTNQYPNLAILSVCLKATPSDSCAVNPNPIGRQTCLGKCTDPGMNSVECETNPFTACF